MTKKSDENIADVDVIEPLYQKGLKSIHPAIGVIDDIAYVGAVIPAKIYNPASETEIERDRHFLITSDHRVIPTNDKELKKPGWKLEHPPTQIRAAIGRWPLEDIERYVNSDELVDPVDVYRNVLATFREYMDYIEPEIYTFNSLWSIGTYFHRLFNSYPYAYFGGTKHSGKTKTLTLLGCVCFNAIQSGNISTSSIFRLVQSNAATLLIDETEKLSGRRNEPASETTREFRNLLLNGYKTGMPVYRTGKAANETFEVEAFNVYSPKATANIGGLDDVLEDRCIPLFLVPAKDHDKKNSDPEITDPRWAEIRAKLCRLYLDYWHEVKLIYDELNQLKGQQLVAFLHGKCLDASREDIEEIAGRQLELWKPLLVIARFLDMKDVSLDLTGEIVRFAIKNVKQKNVENLAETGDMILIQTLLVMVRNPNWNDGFVPISTIRDNMTCAFETEQPWLKPEWVGKAMRRLRFQDKRHLGSRREVRVSKADVEDLATRHGITDADQKLLSQAAQPSQPSLESREFSDSSASSDGSDGPRKITQELIHTVLAKATDLERTSGSHEIDEQILADTLTHLQPSATLEKTKLIIQSLVLQGLFLYVRPGVLRRTT